MPEGGFFEQKHRLNPRSLGVVILLHGAALTALAMSRTEVPFMKVFTPLKVVNYTVPPDPEPMPEAKPEPRRSQIDSPHSVIRTNTEPDRPVRIDPVKTTFDAGPAGQGETVIADPPKPLAPVRAEARILSSSALQPPYPVMEQRAEIEGSVAIRVFIGTDGRVIRAEKVSATTDGFYRATERQALRAWRFSPATLDGNPVESIKVVTVRFQLDR